MSVVVESAVLTLGLFVAYLVVGLLTDARAARHEAAMRRATDLMATALHDPHSGVAPTIRALQRMPSRVLLDVALRLSLDLETDANRRLIEVVGTTGLTRRIRRLSRSRRSRIRHRAARLAHLLPEGSEIRAALLSDPHPAVRKKTLETLGPDHLARLAGPVLTMVEREDHYVRFAAQQALLRSDGRALDAIEAHLHAADGTASVHAVEVAAYFRDPRLFDEIAPYARSADADVRSLVAQALPAGSSVQGFQVLAFLLNDPEARVRMAAVQGIARLRIEALAAQVGVSLADPAWEVRRAAGESLAELGAAGAMVLRAALDHHDRFARDMARQMLDSIHGSSGMRRVPARSELHGLDHWMPLVAALEEAA